MVRQMCGQYKDRKGIKNVIMLQDYNETIDQVAMTKSVHWYDHVLRM